MLILTIGTGGGKNLTAVFLPGGKNLMAYLLPGGKNLTDSISHVTPETKYDASLTIYLAIFQREKHVVSKSSNCVPKKTNYSANE